MYKYVMDVVQYLNSSNANIYSLSEEMGLGKTSLRRKLISLGYELNSDGKWVFNGKPENEPLNTDLTKRLSLKKKNKQTPKQNNKTLSKEISLYEAVMGMDYNNQIRTTIVVEEELVHKTKQIAERSKLKLSDLYSLALHDLVEQYDSK